MTYTVDAFGHVTIVSVAPNRTRRFGWSQRWKRSA